MGGCGPSTPDDDPDRTRPVAGTYGPPPSSEPEDAPSPPEPAPEPAAEPAAEPALPAASAETERRPARRVGRTRGRRAERRRQRVLLIVLASITAMATVGDCLAQVGQYHVAQDEARASAPRLEVTSVLLQHGAPPPGAPSSQATVVRPPPGPGTLHVTPDMATQDQTLWLEIVLQNAGGGPLTVRHVWFLVGQDNRYDPQSDVLAAVARCGSETDVVVCTPMPGQGRNAWPRVLQPGETYSVLVPLTNDVLPHLTSVTYHDGVPFWTDSTDQDGLIAYRSAVAIG